MSEAKPTPTAKKAARKSTSRSAAAATYPSNVMQPDLPGTSTAARPKKSKKAALSSGGIAAPKSPAAVSSQQTETVSAAKKNPSKMRASKTTTTKKSPSADKARPSVASAEKSDSVTSGKARPKQAGSASSRSSKKGNPLAGGVLIITGEHSGDLLGGDLAIELKKRGVKKLYGTGGEHMRKAGVEILEDIETMNVVGFVEALKAYRRLKALARRIVAFARTNGISHAILVDYPGFNLRIAEMFKQDPSFSITYLVSPQLWAWNYGRIKKIKKYVDLMLPLFAFEEEMYKNEGVEAHCVGHPLVYRVGQQLKEQEPIASFGGKTVGLLPGSRRSEISRLLPPMLEAARKLKEKFPKIRFLLPGVNQEAQKSVDDMIAQYDDLKIESMPGRSLRVMEASDLLILSSGTATMEAAYFGTPMVVLYKVGWINFFIISMVIRTRVIGMVNLLARRQVAVELLQTEVTPDTIFKHASDILESPALQSAIRSELEFVKHSLGKGRPATEAARLFLDHANRGK